jgi:hypothetical protein
MRRKLGRRRNLTEEALGDSVSPSLKYITFLARLARALLYRPNRNGGLTIVYNLSLMWTRTDVGQPFVYYISHKCNGS